MATLLVWRAEKLLKKLSGHKKLSQKKLSGKISPYENTLLSQFNPKYNHKHYDYYKLFQLQFQIV